MLATSSGNADKGGPDNGGSDLSAGALAGIVIGAIALLAIVGIVAFLLIRKKRRSKTAVPSAFGIL